MFLSVKKMNLAYTPEEDIQLAKNVATFPILYDIEIRDKNIPSEIIKAWEKVSLNTKRSVVESMKRWRVINESYYWRNKKRTAQKWHLGPHMKFLDRIYEQEKKKNEDIKVYFNKINDIDLLKEILPENTTDSVPEPSERGSDDLEKKIPEDMKQRFHQIFIDLLTEKPTEIRGINDPVAPVTSEPGNSNISCNVEDDVDLFFKSIAISVKALPKPFRFQAKMRTLQMVADLEDDVTTEKLALKRFTQF